MIVIESNLNISPREICDTFALMSKKINEFYLYHLLSESKNNIVFYSFDETETDAKNFPCGLIYNIEPHEDTLNVYIMFVATQYKYRKYGYASLFIQEFIDFIRKTYIDEYRKINIILDSIIDAVTFYERIGFKWIMTDEYNETFYVFPESDVEHFIMIYEVFK